MGFESRGDAPVLSLPPTLYTVSGVPASVYFRSVIRADHPWDSYGINVDWTGPADGLGNDAAQTAHRQQNERWCILPKDADVAAGNLFTSASPLTLELYRGGGKVASASSIVKIAKSTAGSNAFGGQYAQNGQFELPGTHGAAVAWWTVLTDASSGDAAFTCDASDKKFGVCSGKFVWQNTGSYAGISKVFSFPNAANQTYKISFWYKGAALSMNVKYFDGGSYVFGAGDDYQNLPAAADWTYYEHQFTVGSPNAGLLSFFAGPMDKGTVRFDNLQIQRKFNRCLLPLGDSTGYAWPAELVNLSGYNRTAPAAGGGADVLKIALLGSMSGNYADSGGTSRAVKHEAHGGKGWNDFYSSPTLEGSDPNPFLAGGVFDFAAWNETQIAAGLGLGANDWVTILLGINEWGGLTGDASVKSAARGLHDVIDPMIDSIAYAVPGVKIGLIMPLPGGNQDGAGNSYRAYQYAHRYHRNAQLFAEDIIATYAGYETARGLYLIPSCGLDAVNNYQFDAAAKINEYSAATLARQRDNIHPDSPANHQLAAAVWAAIKCNEA
jgi:hypothetical protein